MKITVQSRVRTKAHPCHVLIGGCKARNQAFRRSMPTRASSRSISDRADLAEEYLSVLHAVRPPPVGNFQHNPRTAERPTPPPRSGVFSVPDWGRLMGQRLDATGLKTLPNANPERGGPGDDRRQAPSHLPTREAAAEMIGLRLLPEAPVHGRRRHTDHGLLRRLTFVVLQQSAERLVADEIFEPKSPPTARSRTEGYRFESCRASTSTSAPRVAICPSINRPAFPSNPDRLAANGADGHRDARSM